MSQPYGRHETFRPHQSRKKYKSHDGRRSNFSNYHYYNHKYNMQATPWGYMRFKRSKRPRKPQKGPDQERPPSPFSGTEEYTQRKIQLASDMIKKQLMMPDLESETSENPQSCNNTGGNPATEVVTNPRKDAQKPQTSKKTVQYNVEEIHDKIITHITNLNHGKKMNLICATSSGYDVAIQRIQRQKRLELSRAFREMCSNQTVENYEAINSIIPDIGVKIEDLPLDVIQELSSTLDIHCDDLDFGLISVKTEPVFDENAYSEPVENYQDDNVIPETSFLQNIKQESESSGVRLASNSKDGESQTTFSEIMKTHAETQTVRDFGVEDVKTLEKAVCKMYEIDQEIERLTKLRQLLFVKIQQKPLKKTTTNSRAAKAPKKTTSKRQGVLKGASPKRKKKKKGNKVEDNNDIYREPLDFRDISEKVLVIKAVEGSLVAACESGALHFIDAQTGSVTMSLQVTSVPITSLCIRSFHSTPRIYVGSFENKLHEYSFTTKELISLTNLDESIQCMELAWNFIFIGTNRGSLLRYALQQNSIEFEDHISNEKILVLKATQEGARKVLVVGSSNAPITIRDAMSGLQLRTLGSASATTVYSLLLENSTVYCGTTAHDILVFTFHDGALRHKHAATNSKGVSCMKIVKNLLFASCYNGNVYVYDARKPQFVGLIEGPGGVILSMEILNNLIVVGTMSRQFKSILIPEHILQHH